LIEDPPWKPRVWEVFRENWVNPGYGQGSTFPGCWYDFLYGDIHFLLLDGRYYRTPAAMRPDETPTMLGPVQRQWLLERLRSSPARIKVLVSPVPWVGGIEDKWNGFHAEREQIFSEIETQRISGVVLLSADRHRSDLLITHRPNGYDLYEFMSSRLTNHHRHAEIDQRDGALFSYNKKCSFGLVTIDTRPDDPCILYRIITIDGETVLDFRLDASRLETSR
jgi:alkaline phosphatase D